MIALVCGGRDYKDRRLVWKILDNLNIGMIVHDGFRWADLWARNRNVQQRQIEDPWDEKIDIMLAFPGTPDQMKSLLRQNGVPVLVIS